MPVTFDIGALAKRINVRREEHNRLNPARPVRITSAMSRILANDPEYLPYRKRDDGRRERPVLNPTVRTLVEIAAALGTTVGDLLDESRPVSPTERAMLVGVVRVIRMWLDRAEK